MKRFLRSLLPLLLIGTAWGQYTTASGTLTDTSGTLWIDAAVTATFSPSPGFTGNYSWNGGLYKTFTPVSIQANSSGVFSFSVPDNATITPAKTGWTFTVCPLASTICLTTPAITVTGPTQNVTAFLAPYLSFPLINPTGIQYAYADAEVSALPGVGQLYYNVTMGNYRVWNGSAWTNLSGSGGSGYSGSVNLTGQIGVYVNGVLQSFGNPYTITMNCGSFAGTVDLGNSVSNPSCTFTPSNGTPISGSLGDGMNTVALTSPFLTGVLPYTYSSTTTITGNSSSSTQSAPAQTATRTFVNRIFAGLSTNNMFNSTFTASGSTGAPTLTLSNSSVIGSYGLFTTGVGHSFGPYSPTINQTICIIQPNTVSNPGGGSFTVGGITFPMTLIQGPVSWTNLWGGSPVSYAYCSAPFVSGSYTILEGS